MSNYFINNFSIRKLLSPSFDDFERHIYLLSDLTFHPEYVRSIDLLEYIQTFDLWFETENSGFSYFYSTSDFNLKINKLYSFPANVIWVLYYLKEQGNSSLNYLQENVFKTLESLDTSIGLYIENDVDMQFSEFRMRVFSLEAGSLGSI